jgi:hypothetical protein
VDQRRWGGTIPTPSGIPGRRAVLDDYTEGFINF